MQQPNTVHRRFQKAYLESDPTRRRELLQKEVHAEYFHVELVFLFSARVFYSVFPSKMILRLQVCVV